MEIKKKSFGVWLYILLWSIYIAIITLYAEYIISRPMNVWIQSICTLLIIISTVYLIKFTLKPILTSNKTNQDDSN